MCECESKVVFQDGTQIKVLRGIVDSDSDPVFVIIKRNNGDYRIRKNLIHKIEPVNGVGKKGCDMRKRSY
jgi:hypothetical protein